MASKLFDLIVFGASGFTGRLVAQHLHQRYGAVNGDGGDGGDLADRSLRWAMAGRDLAKLARVRDAIGVPTSVPLIAADAADAPGLARLVAQAGAVITTVGPYARYGQPLVTACAQVGCDYLDLCGEPDWMARMIPLLQRPAQASGARIVFSCGFDSIPFELGVMFLQAEAQRRFGAPLRQVRGRVRSVKGGPSGGTLASALGTQAAMARDPSVAQLMADPFALVHTLVPGFRGPPQPDVEDASYDDWSAAWSVPFLMATINSKNIHRSHALAGHPWGRDFEYNERMLTGAGVAGERRARGLARKIRVQNWLLRHTASRELLRRFVLARPGEGPDQRQRDGGHFDLSFTGLSARGELLRAGVTGDRDPGYGSTSKMIVETALCLLQAVDRGRTPGGVWTPGAAMGLALQQRLQARAGLNFAIEN